MSTQFEFRFADQSDDDELRLVLQKTAMPGNVSLAFTREPSFFTALQAGNVRHQTMVCQDRRTGKIVGFGGRSIRKAYVDGVSRSVGYLSNLRLLPEARGRTALTQAYKYLRRMHEEGGEVSYYLTTILEENRQARAILERKRIDMPSYVPFGTFVTYMVPLRKKVSPVSHRSIIGCNRDAVIEVERCLRDWNSRYQFAPVCTADDIFGRTEILPEFFSSNLYVYKEVGEVLGTLGVWDQQSFKQVVVAGYSAKMRAVRPFYNGVAQLRGLPTLPALGGNIRFVYASLASVRDDNPEIFADLLDKARTEWSGRGYDYLIVGLSEENKLSAVVRRLAARELKSRIYLVHWPEEKIILPQNGKIHLEVATL